MNKRPKIEDRIDMFNALKSNEDSAKQEFVNSMNKFPEIHKSEITENMELRKKIDIKDSKSENEAIISRTSLRFRENFFKGTFFLTAEEMAILEKEKARRRRERLKDKSISCDFSSIIGDAIRKSFA